MKGATLLTAIFGVSLMVSGLKADVADTVSLLNSINQSIEKAVGAKIDDQIPGYFSSQDRATFQMSAIECPGNISNVKQAIDLLKTKLTSDFAHRISEIRIQHFPPGDDTEVIAKIHDGTQVVDICITVFKRSASRVILIPVLVAKTSDDS